jgi:GT2 family glycosyltransferase
MKLSVIIPCYNAAETVGEQLEALARQQWAEDWEVIVVDNRSTDESMRVVEEYRRRLPQLRIVDASAQQGQPYALNVGVEAACGESVAFCDADDVIGIGWLAAIGDALARHEVAASRFELSRLNGSSRNTRTHPQQHGLIPYRYPPFLPHAGGGGMGVRRSVHEALGGFDTSLPLLHDTDFCWRAQFKGIGLHFVRDAIYHVRYRNTLTATYRQARGYGEYNVLLYKRYRPLGMPELSAKDGLKAWRDIVMCLPRLRRREQLGPWVWRLGWRIGRVRGSMKYRVLAL